MGASGWMPTAATRSPRPDTAIPDVVRAIADQAAQLLFYSTAVPLPQREALAEKLAELLPGAARARVPLQLRRRSQRERAPPGPPSTPGARRSSRCAAAGTGVPPRRSRCTDGPRYEEAARRARHAAQPEGALRRRGRARRGGGRRPSRRCWSSRCRDSPARATVRPSSSPAARRVCDDRGAVLLFDEVQCGVGRCGAFSAAEAVGVTPDALTFAKGLAGGLPDRRRGRHARAHRVARPSAIWAARSAAAPCPAPRPSPTST